MKCGWKNDGNESRRTMLDVNGRSWGLADVLGSDDELFEEALAL